MGKPTGHFPRKADLPDPSAPCPDVSLAASTRTIANLGEPDYWAKLCPELSVNGTLKVKPLKKSEILSSNLRQQIHDEGVFQLNPAQMQWPVDIHSLARNMVILMQHGWPATFLLMFDEVWALIHRASSLMAASTGGNACNMDVLCWFVDPNRGDAGFSPHRDRQPDDSPATFRPSDGSPMYSTCWVPLTDACPENSCLYMVPRWADPGYYAGDDDDGPDPLNVALASKESFQSIRAFPAEAGSAIIFSHRIIHWGSRGRKGYHTPRLAVSWGCADDAYEPPYFSREHLPYPPMALRAALACGQMLAYHERFAMTRRQLSLYYKFFMAHAEEFHESYRAKVASEFVAATKELVAAVPSAAAAAAGGAVGQRSGAAAAAPNGAHEGEGGKGGKEGRKKGKKGAAEGGAAAGAVEPAVDNGKPAAAAAAKDKVKEKATAGEKKDKKKDKKKRAAEDCSCGPSSGGGEATAEANAGADGETSAAGKKVKKAKKTAAVAGQPKAAEAQPSKAAAAAPMAPTAAAEKAAAGKAAVSAAEKAVAAGDKKSNKDKKSAGKGISAAATQPAAACSRAAVARRLVDDYQDDSQDEGDVNGDEGSEEDEEEGPGWEGLLLGSGGGGGDGGGGEMDSEDEVMEDALDAMLDAELAGRGGALQDDFDDFQDDM